ncbi:CLUMA_CG002759, isoform A [Clunio marinus]|uniref:CLUMA_CG002759, isoform A n=1 Tax=Clunio marinus TaxID=568069 RepID=A0A1J1HMX9_9DIPT|nr:CLUMA_CG002759, isoform A [Clunio marinus]
MRKDVSRPHKCSLMCYLLDDDGSLSSLNGTTEKGLLASSMTADDKFIEINETGEKCIKRFFALKRH